MTATTKWFGPSKREKLVIDEITKGDKGDTGATGATGPAGPAGPQTLAVVNTPATVDGTKYVSVTIGGVVVKLAVCS